MRTLPRASSPDPAGTSAGPAAATSDRPQQADQQRPAAASALADAHHHDPVLAQALLAAWSGDPAVVVASPPGAGKTRLGAHLAQQLSQRAGLVVAIAAQTRAQAIEVAGRTASTGAKVTLLSGKKSVRPVGLAPAARYAAGPGHLHTTTGVIVSTAARWRVTSDRTFTADILIVDEAWQMTWADLASLGTLAGQIVLIGDPGQIAPVVTGNVSRWAGRATGPHQPAPEALQAAYPGEVTQLTLPQTWRLGPATTALIQPHFYPALPFTSARPARTLHLNGTAQPELAARTITITSKDDPALAGAAALRVRELLAGGSIQEDTGSRVLRQQDIAVIVPHVSQAALIGAYLADLPGVLVNTANAVQGLERDAVVVVHPMAGYRDPAALEFAADLGRTCVALTRHRAHATIIIDTQTSSLLDQALTGSSPDGPLAVQRSVLAALTTAGTA